jgi:hypothetical protein
MNCPYGITEGMNHKATVQSDSVSERGIFLSELSHHIWFTAGAVLVAAALIIAARFIIFAGTLRNETISENLFEGFFISHLFFASLTPAALFSIYKRTLWLGIALAVVSSALTCTLSDIVFPYLGGILLNYRMLFHVCIVEEPFLSWTFIFAGAFLGFFLSQYVRRLSRYTHSVHIFLSSLAAGLYLVAFGVDVLSFKALLFIPILVVSVLTPCVMNDIGVPSMIVSASFKSAAKRKEALEELHEEHHGHKHN